MRHGVHVPVTVCVTNDTKHRPSAKFFINMLVHISQNGLTMQLAVRREADEPC